MQVSSAVCNTCGDSCKNIYKFDFLNFTPLCKVTSISGTSLEMTLTYISRI